MSEDRRVGRTRDRELGQRKRFIGGRVAVKGIQPLAAKALRPLGFLYPFLSISDSDGVGLVNLVRAAKTNKRVKPDRRLQLIPFGVRGPECDNGAVNTNTSADNAPLLRRYLRYRSTPSSFPLLFFVLFIIHAMLTTWWQVSFSISHIIRKKTAIKINPSSLSSQHIVASVKIIQRGGAHSDMVHGQDPVKCREIKCYCYQVSTITPSPSIIYTVRSFNEYRCLVSCRCRSNLSFIVEHQSLKSVQHDGGTTEESSHGHGGGGSGSSALAIALAIVLVEIGLSLGSGRDTRGEGNAAVSGSAGAGECRGGDSWVGLVLRVRAVGVEDASKMVSSSSFQSLRDRERGRGMKVNAIRTCQ